MRAWREEQAKRNKQRLQPISPQSKSSSSLSLMMWISPLSYRVEYRHELQLAREEERKEAAERALQEHREREKRLEVVKQQAS